MSFYDQAMIRAIEEASHFRGATSPNPPVGAVGLDAVGGILGVCVHEKAGGAHAEAKLIDHLQKGPTNQGGSDFGVLHTLVITLEPCNHFGKTPPCTEKIRASGVKRVVFGVRDPNPSVTGGGAEKLRKSGIEVIEGVMQEECEALIRPFKKWILTGRPWVTVKRAIGRDGSMVPPAGQKTFTSSESLKLAHALRRRADAILTGSGTVLSDSPEFTVRHVPDHPGKKRFLVVMDRRGRVPSAWIRGCEEAGFTVRTEKDIERALRFLGKAGCLEVLVEAGPKLSQEILSCGLWDEEILFAQGGTVGDPDRMEVRMKNGL